MSDLIPLDLASCQGTEMSRTTMPRHYVQDLEGEYTKLPKHCSPLSVHCDPMKIHLEDLSVHCHPMKIHVDYLAVGATPGIKFRPSFTTLRPGRARKIKAHSVDGKTLSDRLDESYRQLLAANVIVPDHVTMKEAVDLYFRVPVNLRRALCIHVVSKFIPDESMSIGAKSAMAKTLKFHLFASLSQLEIDQANCISQQFTMAIAKHLDIKIKKIPKETCM